MATILHIHIPFHPRLYTVLGVKTAFLAEVGPTCTDFLLGNIVKGVTSGNKSSQKSFLA